MSTLQYMLQFNTIFLSILIEALPFVLVGVFISGLTQVFVTEEKIGRIIPQNRFVAVLLASLLGVFFLSCECGIVPIVRRLIKKGVPFYAGIAFMLTAPIINPVVLFATYVAFGNNWQVMLERAGLAFGVAVTIGWLLALFYRQDPLRSETTTSAHSHHHHDHDHDHEHSHDTTGSRKERILQSFAHASDEFFQMGKFLILGALVAAAVQIFVPTAAITSMAGGKMSGSLVMMGLAFLLSLCSEADAFIAASFHNGFLLSSLVAFMVFGAMIDIKNTLMMLSAFKTRFVLILISLVILLVFTGSLLIGR